MKTLRYVGMAVLAIMLCVNFTACSDDEDEEKQPTTPPEETPAPPQEETPATPATLAGTTWKITSSTDDGVFPGISLTFHEDKTVTTDSPDFTVGLTYEAKGNTLKIVWLWGGAYNEYMEGPLTIEGNTATYTFNWFNMDGSCNTIDDPRAIAYPGRGSIWLFSSYPGAVHRLGRTSAPRTVTVNDLL